MIISIDRRLVTAASLVWETFSDHDAHDYYWNSTLSLSARIREGVITAGTLFHFLFGVQAWLHGLDYEDIEQYQTALPAAPSPKLLGAAPVALDAVDPWEGDVEPIAVVSVDQVSEISVSPQFLLAPAREISKPKANRKRQGSKNQPKAKSRAQSKSKSKVS